MNAHLDKIESVFKIYYETLDDLRNKILGEEYAYLDKMTGIENRLKKLVENMKNYSIMEFYHEKDDLELTMRGFKHDLDSFNIYLPGSVLAVDDMFTASKNIMVDLRERINGYVQVSKT